MDVRRLGPYEIECELGAGGMGRVVRARGPDGVVALKVVHPHLVATPDALRRFRREIDVGVTVRHPNVVRTLGGGEIDGHHVLVMEFVEGQTLAALGHDLERVPEELCRHVAREICRGLAAIHAAGIVHRDVKPENVIVTPGHDIKIMDLGVARPVDDALRLSQTGAFVGSLHHAAPEQFTDGGRDLDGRVDLHALGLLLYELAGGSSPYLADDVPAIIHNVLHVEPRRLGDVNPQVSAFFEEVVHTLLAKDREQRFASAADVLTVLEAGEASAWWLARARALRSATDRPLRRIRIPRETAVHGREVELDVLRARFDCALEGDGQVVLIQGEAGIGKSRLVDEFVARLASGDIDFDFLHGSYPSGGAATASGAFSTAYREHFGVAGSAAYLADSPSLVPAFDAVLRGETPPPGIAPLT